MKFPLLPKPRQRVTEWLLVLLVPMTGKTLEAIQRRSDESLEGLAGSDLVRRCIIGNERNAKAE